MVDGTGLEPMFLLLLIKNVTIIRYYMFTDCMKFLLFLLCRRKSVYF
nr:MAG TPA: hypothetical protein [Caudoviricetes sp.]